MSGISTHILDLTHGTACAGVKVSLEHAGTGGQWRTLASASTDADGRVKDLLSGHAHPGTGTYRLRIATGEYWKSLAITCFHPVVEITFTIADAARHHHVPLLLGPFGYTTYRGT